jgi:hypothetical protein
MNTAHFNDAQIVSNYDGGWFTRWGAEFSKGTFETVDENGNPYIYGAYKKERTGGKFPQEIPTHEMILDISSIGGFLDNIVGKAKKHAPLWRRKDDSIHIDGRPYNLEGWYRNELKNSDWIKNHTPFDIPEIMRPLLGHRKYTVREDILNRIENA